MSLHHRGSVRHRPSVRLVFFSLVYRSKFFGVGTTNARLKCVRGTRPPESMFKRRTMEQVSEDC